MRHGPLATTMPDTHLVSTLARGLILAGDTPFAPASGPSATCADATALPPWVSRGPPKHMNRMRRQCSRHVKGSVWGKCASYTGDIPPRSWPSPEGVELIELTISQPPSARWRVVDGAVHGPVGAVATRS